MVFKLCLSCKAKNPVRCKLCQSCGNSFGRGGTKKSKYCDNSSVEKNRLYETETESEVAQVLKSLEEVSSNLLRTTSPKSSNSSGTSFQPRPILPALPGASARYKATLTALTAHLVSMKSIPIERDRSERYKRADIGSKKQRQQEKAFYANTYTTVGTFNTTVLFPANAAKNCHELSYDLNINGDSSTSEQQPDGDNAELEDQEKECLDSEQGDEEERTDTVEKDQHSEEKSSKPVTDSIITSASTVPKQPNTTITIIDSAEYHEQIKKLEDLRLPPLLRSSYLTPAVSRSVWSVKGTQGQSSGNGEGSDGTVVRKGPKIKIVKRSQKPKRLTDRPTTTNKKEMVVGNDQRKGRGRPKGSGWLQQEKEEELEQVLEDHGEFFSLVLVGINGRLSQQNTFWNKLKKQSL